MIEMHENLKKIGVKRTEQKVSGLGKAAWRKKQNGSFFLGQGEQVQAFGRRSALRESLVKVAGRYQPCLAGLWRVSDAN